MWGVGYVFSCQIWGDCFVFSSKLMFRELVILIPSFPIFLKPGRNNKIIVGNRTGFGLTKIQENCAVNQSHRHLAMRTRTVHLHVDNASKNDSICSPAGMRGAMAQRLSAACQRAMPTLPQAIGGYPIKSIIRLVQLL